MKRLAFILAVTLIVSIPISALAAPRAMVTNPELTITGTTATCKTTVVGDRTSDFIQVTMKLMYGSSCVASWNGSGNGYVYMSKTATVTAGRTYTLVVEVTVNGVAKDPVSVTKTC